MAIVKLQVLCDHFDDEAQVVELMTELKLKLKLNHQSSTANHNELSVYSKLSNGEEIRQVMGVIEIEFYNPNPVNEAKKIREVLNHWDLGEQGAWNVTAVIDWSGGFENQLSDIEKMSYTLGKLTVNEEEVPF